MAKQWAKAFYNSKAWRGTRAYVLNRDRYTCTYCYGRAEEVHHVIELTPTNIGDVNISLNPDNLISLCGECHKKITKGAGDIKEGYVFNKNGQAVEL